MESRGQLVRGRLEGEGLSKKEKGLMNVDNSVVISEGWGYKETKWQWKKYKIIIIIK